MFTGIIESCVRVIHRSKTSLTLARPESINSITVGQSLACNGACLSVSEYTDSSISFDVLSETFRKTNLSNCEQVNIERALPSNGRFEGHIVLGHVDDTISLLSTHQESSGIEYRFSLPTEKKYLVEKGSIALNGISLTIGKISNTFFSVYIIPLTLEKTNLKDCIPGQKVCVEYDYLGKLLLNNHEKT